MNEYKKLDLLNTSNDMQSNSDAFSNHTQRQVYTKQDLPEKAVYEEKAHSEMRYNLKSLLENSPATVKFREYDQEMMREGNVSSKEDCKIPEIRDLSERIQQRKKARKENGEKKINAKSMVSKQGDDDEV